MSQILPVRTALLAALALTAAAGCVGVKNLMPGLPNRADDGGPKQMAVAWNNKVTFAPDPTRGGAPEVYLMGRLYLFALEPGTPFLVEGNAIVDLYDATPRNPPVDPVMLEELRLDAETLKRLIKEDTMGKGYTIPFVWHTYRPDITHVNMIVRFDPLKGQSLMHQSGHLTLDHAATREMAAMQAKHERRK